MVAVPEDVLLQRPIDDTCDEGVGFNLGNDNLIDACPEVISGPFTAGGRRHLLLCSQHAWLVWLVACRWISVSRGGWAVLQRQPQRNEHTANQTGKWWIFSGSVCPLLTFQGS